MADTLRELGLAVPDQIAIVGSDNWDVMAESCRPPLTTVDLNLTELGRSAADRLLATIDGTPSHGPHTMPCQLVVRESTGAPAARRRGTRMPAG